MSAKLPDSDVEFECPECHGSGKIYNNADQSSSQHIDCEACRTTGVVPRDKFLSYHKKLVEEHKALVDKFLRR